MPKISFLIVMVALTLAVGCPSSTGPDKPPQREITNTNNGGGQTNVAAAELEVFVSGGVVGNSPVAGKLRRVTFLITIRESAGVDSHIDYFRMDVWDRLNYRERAEITAADIRRAFGTNKIRGGHSWAFRVSFDYNMQDIRTFKLTTGISDVNGHRWDYIARGSVSSMAGSIKASRIEQ